MVRIEGPRFPIFVCTKETNTNLQIRLDRTAQLSLSEQIRISISGGYRVRPARTWHPTAIMDLAVLTQ